jgi:hypothetical protein
MKKDYYKIAWDSSQHEVDPQVWLVMQTDSRHDKLMSIEINMESNKKVYILRDIKLLWLGGDLAPTSSPSIGSPIMI